MEATDVSSWINEQNKKRMNHVGECVSFFTPHLKVHPLLYYTAVIAAGMLENSGTLSVIISPIAYSLLL